MDTYLANKTTLPLTSISHLMGHSTQMVQHYSDHFSEELYANAAKILSDSDLWPKAITKSPFITKGQSIFINPDTLENSDIAKNPGEDVDLVKCLTQVYAQLGMLLKQMKESPRQQAAY